MNMKLSDNFSSDEFMCRCGCGADQVSSELINGLQAMRNVYGKPIYINSGVRCKAHNTAEGGSPESEHVPDPATGQGDGCDIRVKDSRERYSLVQLAHLHFPRVGIDGDFIHVGCRESKLQYVTWLYKPTS